MSPGLRAASFLGLLWIAASGAGAQEQDQSQLRDISEAAEIRIGIPASAAAYPALHEEMLTRARQELRDFKAEAEVALAESKEIDGLTWTPWSLDYIYEPRYLGPVYASFLVNILRYQGGAHPSLEYDAVTRDLELNEPVALFDLFIDAEEGSPALVAISDHVRMDLARQKEERLGERVEPDQAEWLDAVAPRPENFERFTFEPARQEGMVAGLSFHYAPYVVGAYAEGPYEVFVPAEVFSDHLAGYFPSIFGGEPVSMSRLSNYEEPGVFVFLEAPRDNQVVSSPLEVSGEAPAAWFDAGDVTLRLQDFEGNVLGEATAVPAPDVPASAISSGMMSFTGSLPFEAEGKPDGQLFIAPPDGTDPGVSTFVRF